MVLCQKESEILKEDEVHLFLTHSTLEVERVLLSFFLLSKPLIQKRASFNLEKKLYLNISLSGVN